MRRGEVWWAALQPPHGRRPVLLLTRNEAYAVRTMVTVAPLTPRMRGLRVEVPLGPEDGLPKRCAVNLDNINTIYKSELVERITALKPEKLAAVEEAIRFALGFSA